MDSRFSADEVHDYWASQAQAHGADPAASWSDRTVIDMEVREIAARLSDGDRVLEVGCANGYSTVELAARREVEIDAFDYVPEMIGQAQARADRERHRLVGRVTFAVGDVLQLHATDAYDKVVSVRVMINLGSWEDQLQGMRGCVRALVPGGTLLMSEATVQGWHKLNDFRAEWGLPAIPMPPFNNYLDQERVAEALEEELASIEVVDFASTYFVGTRVLKPLLAQALGDAAPDVADPLMHWNRWFGTLPASGDYGTQKLFVMTKR
jgi:ubiquinone/menaquinone biosynthesis C-methylase UbiE